MLYSKNDSTISINIPFRGNLSSERNRKPINDGRLLLQAILNFTPYLP